MAKTGEVKLGDIVEEKITGFTGIVDGIIEYRNGCRRIGIRSKELIDGKPIEPQWFDEPDMKVLKKEDLKKSKTPPGGPAFYLPPSRIPTR